MNIKLLKAFSVINNGIVITEGAPLVTISAALNILAVSNEVSDVSFAIYDLNNFLSVLSLTSDERTMSVDGSAMTIKDGKTVMSYMGGNPKTIITPPSNISPLTDADYTNEFTLSVTEFKKLMDACSVLQAKKLQFNFDGTNVTIKTEADYADANSFACDYDTEEGVSRAVKLDVTTIKIPVAEYKVSLGPKAMRFVSDECTFYIVLAI
jgi:hypothetical protein